jgi:hypothetical protein
MNKYKAWVHGCMVTVPLFILTLCILSSFGLATLLHRIGG